jgi:hypothetical protein
MTFGDASFRLMLPCGGEEETAVTEGATQKVIVNEAVPALAAPAKVPKPRSQPRWETEARERLRTSIRRLARPLGDLVARDANEGDTRLLVTDFLREALGYDTHQDLTTEYQVRGDFADYGVRIDGELIAFIEVKRVKTPLRARQLRHVEMYSVNEGVEWAILTNGAQWQVFHLGDRVPIQIDLALDVDLLADNPLAQKADELFYLTRESLKRRQIDELWQARRATSPKSLATVLTSDSVTEAIRKELRRQTGQRVDGGEIARLLRDTVLRPECLG